MSTQFEESDLRTVTIQQARTHLSRLVKEAQAGETIVIVSDGVAVAQITAAQPAKVKRPSVGVPSSLPVICEDDAFLPLSDQELKV